MKNNKCEEETNKYLSPVIEISLFSVIILIAVFLRFYQLRTNPGWYSDEGSFINVADNLSHGRWQYFAIRGSPLLIGRPPLFFVLLAGIFDIFGVDIIALRIFTATLSMASIMLLYWMAREMFAPGLALLSASISTDYLGIVAVALALMTFLIYDRRRLVLFTLWTFIASIFILIPVWFADPSGFIGDLRFTFQRVSVSPAMQIMNIIIFYYELLRREVWLVLGFIGLLLLPNPRAKGMILFIFGTTIFLTVRSLPPVGRNYHHLIQLFPFIALGLGRFLSLSYNLLSRVTGDYLDRASLQILRWDRTICLSKIYSIAR